MTERVVKNGLLSLEEKGSKADAYRFIGSTEDPDRDGDVIRLAGWNTDNFEKNPVVFYGHDYRGHNVKFPVGTAKVMKDDTGKRLIFDITFTDAHEDAKTVKALVDEGVLRATSVGFVAKQVNIIVDAETQNVLGREFVAQELLEISIVPLPANPHAVRLALSKGLVTEEKAAEWGLVEKDGGVIKRLDELLAGYLSMATKLGELEQLIGREVARLDAKMVLPAETEEQSNQDSKQEEDHFEKLLALSQEAAGALVPVVTSKAKSDAAEVAALLKGIAA